MHIALATALLCISATPSPAPAPSFTGPGLSEEIASDQVRRGLRGLVPELARLGDEDDVAQLRELLIALGDAPEEHARLEAKWERELQKANAKPKAGAKLAKAQKSFAKKLQRHVRSLERELASEELADRDLLAELVLQLDSESQPARDALGHSKREGRWFSEQSTRWREDSERVNDLLRDARELEIEVVHGQSSNRAAIAIYGDDAHQVSSHGVFLHGGIAPKKLERILRESLRAIAVSHALLDGKLEVPDFGERAELIMLSEEPHFDLALEEAADHGGIDQAELARQRETHMRSFPDRRGWRTSRWRTEADFEALVLWTLSDRWMGWEVQPCFLAGHLNWLCLNFFGTTMPSVTWKEEAEADGRSSADRIPFEDALWRSAASSLFGCRAWMKSRMRAGHRYPFERAIVSELGMIVEEPLLKATLVNEYLQSRGELRQAIEGSRHREDRIVAVEAALGRKLPELEEEWSAWLFDQASAPGLVQRLDPQAVERPKASKAALTALKTLQKLRKQAFSAENAWSESLELFAELSVQAQAHAHYLTLNPEQGKAWPDAHEEYPDKDGFTPAGAWAGGHSVIHFVPDPVEAINGWMGTFYHRLPLLDPGLFGIGYGNEGIVTVLDSGSLVAPYWSELWVLWPPEDARKVPLRFEPELPNPVPGEDQGNWGYPITVQVYKGEKKGDGNIEMKLFLGKTAEGEPLDCHYLTPTKPAFDKLVPPGAYCLIPKAPLKSGSTYTVSTSNSVTGKQRVWSFTTK